jgi:glucose-6-phosphate isomerase
MPSTRCSSCCIRARTIPVEFIASKTPGHDFDPAHHETLLINCFAQGAALDAGQGKCG